MKTTIIAKNKEHLLSIIAEEMQESGDRCDLNHIDVSQIRNMAKLFFLSDFNGDISRWNVSNVINMDSMFRGSEFNGDISAWNVSNVLNISSTIAQSEFNRDLSKWDVRNVTYFRECFEGCPEDIRPYWSKISNNEERIAAIEAYQQKQQLNKLIDLNTNKDNILKI